jgi:hypothetical protein
LAPHALLDAGLQSRAEAMGSNSERVGRNSELLSQISTRFNSGQFVLLIVLHDQLEVFRGQFPQTALEAFTPRILTGRSGRWVRHGMKGFLFPAGAEILEKDVTGYSRTVGGKVENGLACFEVSRDPVDRFVGEVFGRRTSPPLEKSHQLLAERFVLLPGFLTIGIELQQQQVECTLCQGPAVFG